MPYGDAGGGVMRGLSWRRIVVVGALVAAGCAGEGPAPSARDAVATPVEETSAAPSADPATRELPSTVVVKATGAAQFTWRGEQDVVVSRHRTEQVNLLNVGFRHPEILPDDPVHRFRWAVDLVDGYEDKPGTFTLTGEVLPGTSVRHNVFLVWMRVVEEARDKPAVFEWDEVVFLEDYHELRQPCVLEVGEGVLSGSLRCPELADKQGKVVGLEVSWEPAA